MERKGTHGTCRSRARRIDAGGFRSSQGRAGTGVYLWAGRYSRALAIGWYNYCYEKGTFATDTDAHGMVIYCSVEAEETAIFNLEDPDFVESIEALARFRNITNQSPIADVAALWDGYVKAIERRENTTYVILEKRLAAPPSRYCDYPVTVLGQPYCFIVRAPDRIRVERKEEIR
jgi:hypothetical protein